MKLKKATYFSIFFLLCFLTSFGVRTVQNFNTSYSKLSASSYKTTSLNSKETGNYIKTEFLFEENENESESESDFHVPAFILPFFVTYFQYNELEYHHIFPAPLAEKLTNPIYIAVCNFRI